MTRPRGRPRKQAAESAREVAEPLTVQVSVPPHVRPHWRNSFFQCVTTELVGAYGKHGVEQWGRHEFYAILLEEVEELWDAIKTDADQTVVEAELVQVAAMCLRYFETRDRYREPRHHP